MEYRIEQYPQSDPYYAWHVFHGNISVAAFSSQKDAQLFVGAKQTQTMCGPIKFVTVEASGYYVLGKGWFPKASAKDDVSFSVPPSVGKFVTVEELQSTGLYTQEAIDRLKKEREESRKANNPAENIEATKAAENDTGHVFNKYGMCMCGVHANEGPPYCGRCPLKPSPFAQKLADLVHQTSPYYSPPEENQAAISLTPMGEAKVVSGAKVLETGCSYVSNSGEVIIVQEKVSPELPKDDSPIFGINWGNAKKDLHFYEHRTDSIKPWTPDDDLPQPDIMIDTGGEG